MSDQKKGASIYALIEPGSLVKADEGQQAIFSSIKHLTAVKGGEPCHSAGTGQRRSPLLEERHFPR